MTDPKTCDHNWFITEQKRDPENQKWRDTQRLCLKCTLIEERPLSYMVDWVPSDFQNILLSDGTNEASTMAATATKQQRAFLRLRNPKAKSPYPESD